MSAVIIMTPVVIAAWPVISAAVVSAVGAMGYSAVSGIINEQNKLNVDVEKSVDIELDNSDVVGETMAREEELVFTKGEITLKFRRDIRGKLQICVTGQNRPDSELQRIGEEIAQKVTQQYIYNRVISELKEGDFSIIDQEVAEDETIKIQVRNWK